MLLDALAKSLLADEHVSSARILAINTTDGILSTAVWWVKQPGSLDGPRRVEEAGLQVGSKPSVNYPWQVFRPHERKQRHVQWTSMAFLTTVDLWFYRCAQVRGPVYVTGTALAEVCRLARAHLVPRFLDVSVLLVWDAPLASFV